MNIKLPAELPFWDFMSIVYQQVTSSSFGLDISFVSSFYFSKNISCDHLSLLTIRYRLKGGRVKISYSQLDGNLAKFATCVTVNRERWSACRGYFRGTFKPALKDCSRDWKSVVSLVRHGHGLLTL